eukprot:CAMPEP_0195287110 /NCGR_PEP_ID=MMETSP0707-20130614/4311_1 /TAXON_ID=33640 /ORGANISM="Asterionellopsis glacialis, Strain CCMP134" /LENGTH=404 /DNA_ID=CAMNT_0040346837 /DNA_START=85 /DNA_END=1299 /DNA_ORIENTATION=-
MAVSFAAGAAAASLICSFWITSKSRKARQKNDVGGEVKKESSSIRVHDAESHCWKIVEQSLTGALIYVMDKLDLYETLWTIGPASAVDIAAHTGYSERWLTELLSQATAAGFCEYDGTTHKFTLRATYAPFLRGPEQEKRSLAGMFEVLHELVGSRPDATIAAATNGGIGVDYDFGNLTVDGLDRKNRNFFLYNLMPDIIDKVKIPSTGEPLVDMLKRGGVNVADIGCGCGTSTVVLAKAFPKCQFYAYESSIKSLKVLEDRIQTNKLGNITLCNVAESTLVDGPEFAFVYSHDLLHDMVDPRSLIKDVHCRLAPRGGSCWVVVDVKCKPTLEENLTNRAAATNYGFSCLLCLSCATSCPHAEGLGTMGFHTALAHQWMTDAGFEHFEEIEIKSKPDNSCFIVA